MNALTDRWDPDRQAMAWRALHGQVSIEDVAFGKVDGLWDMRGFARPATTHTKVATSSHGTTSEQGALYSIEGLTGMRDTVWSNIDFTGAHLFDLRLDDVRIENCNFTRANLAGLRMWGTHIAASNFTRADLSDSMVGAWLNGRSDSFADCLFEGTKLKELMTDAGEFVRCKFSSTSITSQQFLSTVFIDCVFACRLREVIFDGRELSDSTGRPGRNTMRGCDFSQAELDDVEFLAIDVSAIKLPANDPDILILPHFSRTAKDVKRWLASEAAAHYSLDYRRAISEMIDEMHPELMDESAASMVNFRDFRFPDTPELEEIARGAFAIAALGSI